MFRIPVLICFFCINLPVFGNIRFSTDFEEGQVYLINPTKAGETRLKLAPNTYLEKWPKGMGICIIHDSHPEKREVFNYSRRIKNEIRGTKGLQFSHASFADVSTGGFNGWDLVDDKIKLDSERSLHGSFAALIRFDTTADQILLNKSFPPVEELWGRFYVALSKEALSTFPKNKAWFFEIPTRLRIGIHKNRNNDSVCFLMRFHSGKKGNPQGDVYFYGPNPAVPLRPYCMEFHFKGGQRGGGEFWIDGKHVGSNLRMNMEKNRYATGITFGRFTWAKIISGFMILDDVKIGNSRMGPVPSPPKPYSENVKITGSTPIAVLSCRQTSDASFEHGLIEWQSLGEDFSLLSTYLLGQTSRPLQDFKMDLNRFQHLSGWWRVRIKNRFNNFSDWSRPRSFDFTQAAQDIKDTACAWIKAVKSETEAELNNIPACKPGQWVDLELIGQVLDTAAFIGATALIHKGDFIFSSLDSLRDNMARRGGFTEAPDFAEKSSYSFQFHMRTKTCYSTFLEKSGKTYEVLGQTFKYLDGKKTRFTQSKDMFTISTAVRLSEGVMPGLWFIDAFASTTGPRSRMVRAPLIVAADDTVYVSSQNNKILLILFPACFVALFLFYMFQKNRFHFKRKGIRSRWEEADKDPVLRLAKAYILAHLSDSELGIEPVAAHVNLGRSSFSRLFNEKLGVSFPQYIASLRIEKAKELLKGTNLQISEIAFQVGFESVSHFNRTFKKTLGITPRAFRNQ